MAQAKYVNNAIRPRLTAAGAKPSTNPVGAADSDLLIARLAGHKRRHVQLNPHSVDLEKRADQVENVLSALSAFLTAILDNSARNIPGCLSLPQIHTLISGLEFLHDQHLPACRGEDSRMEGRMSRTLNPADRRCFIGGSDARIIMGDDEAALLRLWREKRGEVEPEDLSGNLIVQLGLATEELNRRWYEANTGQVITDVQRQVRHPTVRWMGATLDGRVEATGAVFEAKFMLPWSFSEEAAAEKHMAQLQHNMWVVASRTAVLSVITGGGKWVEITTHADPLYQHLIVTAERKFWRCVESGEPPRLFGVEPPKPRIQAVRIVDMSGSNAWAEFAGIFARTRAAHLEHEQAKTELKSLDAGGCQGGDRPWRPGQALEIRRRELRPPRPGGQPCRGRVNPSPAWRLHWPRRRQS